MLKAPGDRVSLFTSSDKLGQVETFLWLCLPPHPDTILKLDRGLRVMRRHSS